MSVELAGAVAGFTFALGYIVGSLVTRRRLAKVAQAQAFADHKRKYGL